MSKPSHSGDDAQLDALLDTVERLRQSRFPHLESDLVREILILHSAATSDAELARGVEQAVETRIKPLER